MTLKDYAVIIVLSVAYSLVGTLDYQDAQITEQQVVMVAQR